MESQKTLTRLTTIQKKLMETLDKNEVIESLEQFGETKNIKKYNEMHNCINEILSSIGIEPHEIFTLLNSYEGTNKNCQTLKKFIVDRNVFIINYARETKSWQKQINNITEIFNKLYNDVRYDIIDKIITDILMTNTNLFDICQCKLTFDKNNIKKINLNLDDQKTIIKSLLMIGYTKK